MYDVGQLFAEHDRHAGQDLDRETESTPHAAGAETEDREHNWINLIVDLGFLRVRTRTSPRGVLALHAVAVEKRGVRSTGRASAVAGDYAG